VLGSNAELIDKVVKTKTDYTVYNTEWEEGMASSIRYGLRYLLSINPSAEAVIFMVCDQPYVTAALLNDLINTYLTTGKIIVASSYQNTIGNPALFHKTIFPQLLQLQGDTGARMIMQQNLNDVARVEFAKGNIDIDTMEEYEALSQKNI
jgi:molybdenum cofactor cytidylyltransferase